MRSKGKSAHDLTDDPKLSSAAGEIVDEAEKEDDDGGEPADVVMTNVPAQLSNEPSDPKPSGESNSKSRMLVLCTKT